LQGKDSLILLYDSLTFYQSIFDSDGNLYVFGKDFMYPKGSRNKIIFELIIGSDFIKKVGIYDNNIFIASASGFVYRYDKNNNKLTKLILINSEIQINDLHITNDGEVLLATNKGVYIYEKLKNGFIILDKIGNVVITSITSDEKFFYFASYSSILKFDKNNNSLYPMTFCGNCYINMLNVDKNDNLWFLCEKMVGIFISEKKHAVLSNLKNKEIPMYSSFTYSDKYDSFYIGSYNTGIDTVVKLNLYDSLLCNVPNNSCGKIIKSIKNTNGSIDFMKTHYIGQNKKFYIGWNMYSKVKDKIIILDGNDINNVKLFESDFISESGNSNVFVSKSGYITIKIKSKSKKESNWEYYIECVD
jgi:hypothetical protein